MSAATAALIGSAVASAIATTKKKATKPSSKPAKAAPKKAKKKKSSGKLSSARLIMNGESSRLSAAPVNLGVTAQGSTRHSPVVIGASVLGATLRQMATVGLFQLKNAFGTQTDTNIFNVDAASGGIIGTNFAWMTGPQVSLSTNFTRYRMRKFQIRYVPLVPTSTGGQVFIGSNPEVTTASNSFTFQQSAQFTTHVVTPAWQPCTFNAMAAGGLRSEWLYVDGIVTVQQAILRQESCGIMLFNANCPGLAINTDVGHIWIDYELELAGLAPESLLTALPPSSPSEHTESKQSEPDSEQVLNLPSQAQHAPAPQGVSYASAATSRGGSWFQTTPSSAHPLSRG